VILDMLLARVNLAEPVLKDKANEWRTNKIKKFQEKFHIPVQNSGNYYGVCDPTGKVVDANGGVEVQGTIPAGKVYFHKSGSSSPHSGPLIVGRSPATAPWDIQKYDAVGYIPELIGYTDVLIFSVLSSRPDFDVLGGGDLDGDKYWVCWEPLLLLHFRPYPPPPPEPKPPPLNDCDPTVDLCDEIPRQINYLVSKMFYFELQQISEMHQKVADVYSTHSEFAIALSKAHSMATDEDKTGLKPRVPYYVKEFLERWGKFRLIPHFKTKSKDACYRPAYHSKGILGQLYDTMSQRLVEIDVACYDIKIDEELLVVEYECCVPLANEFIDRVYNDLHGAYNHADHDKVTNSKIKQSVFSNSNTVFDDLLQRMNVESLQLSSAIYYVAYQRTIDKKEQKEGFAKLMKYHEYPWLCERVRRDLVYLKAQRGEKPGIRPSSIHNASFRSLFTKR
jgi:hypothetical protein